LGEDGHGFGFALHVLTEIASFGLPCSGSKGYAVWADAEAVFGRDLVNL
jgi:hypothetical protein